MEIIEEKAPAKINLSLDVLHKRDDGYHEMELVMTSIDLADRLTLTLLEEDRILIESNNGFLPLDERNIAYRSAMLLKKEFNIRLGVHIYIEKHIPIAAGLGGGSSDAAATLRGLNRLWNIGLDLDELAELGTQIGSDVPFCIYGGSAYAYGRGEKIKPLEEVPQCWVVLVKPRRGISSWTVFEGLEVDKLIHPDTKGILNAIDCMDYPLMTQYLGNALENVSMHKQPKIGQIKHKMLEFGADTALMSGTGPTIYGLCQKYSRAQRVFNGLKGFCNEVYLVRTLK
ncbi:4-(cytidine 5'-diphospho)-2-C-methyl-D-erythritol kinase [Desemzia sp. RIT804]|uniref:4-(cytidine 5'-diphospho)-2-C-methyl-D-erythritol kinase n=1 Tax=Desemzia sp. RIT 804 TaxID=2810209 RepID=UPI001950C9CD|nr:4-(cytidine 5'-diphospho)-2-C-methyl-D-erythritol kinase [Desemzia sp. RIT 804]MBM6615413.1 4-(cytidine 5'-diphospho)-2-C-methyl-D-erythritol kinase [Desemzia sp. RIT 804]